MNTMHKISHQKNCSFDILLETPSPLYPFLFGISGMCSGNTESGVYFYGSGSRIYDHLERFIYSYRSGDKINVSGNLINGNVFNYYINQSPLFSDVIVNFTATGIYYSSSDGGGGILSLDVFGSDCAYDFIYEKNSKQNLNTVSLVNTSNQHVAFDILSIDILSNCSSFNYLTLSGHDALPKLVSGGDSFNFDIIFSPYLVDRTEVVVPISVKTTCGTILENITFDKSTGYNSSISSFVLDSGVDKYGELYSGFVNMLLTSNSSSYIGATLNIGDINFTGDSISGISYYGNSNGVYMSTISGNTISGNTISGNTISGNTFSGLVYTGVAPYKLYDSIYLNYNFAFVNNGDYVDHSFIYSGSIADGIKTGYLDMRIDNNGGLNINYE